eukprot:193902_1
MSIYATYKFKIIIALKEQIDEYKRNNIKFKSENKQIRLQVNRVKRARSMLRETKNRLTEANDKNRDNLLKFESIEENLKVTGQKIEGGMSEIYKQAVNIREKWREEFLLNEREMLQAVYKRYEHKRDRSKIGMTADGFHEFQSMLPSRYKRRFLQLGTFHTLAAGSSAIDPQQFAIALDLFAEMETDDKMIDVTPHITPFASPQ